MDHLRTAVAHIGTEVGEILAQSRVLETVPVGPADHLFLNAALICRSLLPPEATMLALLSIEAKMGRIRKERWGNRIIDLDMLLCLDDEETAAVCSSEILTLPHPLMLERDFVLKPAVEVAPHWLHPGSQCSLAAALTAFSARASATLFGNSYASSAPSPDVS